MKFIMLHLNSDGRKVWMNPDRISIVRQEQGGGTQACIHVSDCSQVVEVEESPEEVVRRCEEADMLYEELRTP